MTLHHLVPRLTNRLTGAGYRLKAAQFSQCLSSLYPFLMCVGCLLVLAFSIGPIYTAYPMLTAGNMTYLGHGCPDACSVLLGWPPVPLDQACPKQHGSAFDGLDKVPNKSLKFDACASPDTARV